MRLDRFTASPEQLFDQDPELWTSHSYWQWHALHDNAGRDPYTGKKVND